MKWRKLAFVFLTVAAIIFSAALSGCAEGASVAARGSILSSDGVVLAESRNVIDGAGQRAYPFGEKASCVLGSCYSQNAPDGIEQVYGNELLQGEDVRLTLDSRVQEAAFDALGDCKGAAVVLDPATGAILAMASTPAYDPLQTAVVGPDMGNHATELHIPGSTFKTITLAAALESGTASIEDRFPAPPEISFADGSIVNYGAAQYDDLELSQAYARSVNTVFAQLALRIGVNELVDASRRFGFDDQAITDFPCEVSTVFGTDGMSQLMQGWTGVGQALYQADGTLQGPMMTPLEGAAIAATVVNGGKYARPFLVDAIDGAQTEQSRMQDEAIEAVSASTAAQIGDCMREVVESGTGAGAAVPGVDVGGKTGTAETGYGGDDGWFIGFAQDDGRSYAVSIMIEDAQSSDAAAVAKKLVQVLFNSPPRNAG